MKSPMKNLILVIAMLCITVAAIQSAVAGIVIEHGKTSPLCKAIAARNAGSPQLGHGAMIAPPSDARTDFIENKENGYTAGGFSKNHFDIDNNGHAETVYGFHPSFHGQDADIYFASPGSAIDNSWPKMDEALLWKSSPYIFPYAHGRCRHQPCGQDDEDGELTIQSYLIAGVIPLAYRFRYLHVSPFVWRGSTYFLLNSLDSGVKNISSVVKPEKNKPLEEICVFRAEASK